MIESIEQVENDRIVELYVSNKNEIGDHIQATLIIEIMGKHVIFYWLIKAAIKSSKLSNTSAFTK